MLALRPYQQEALDSLLVKIKETEEPLLVSASVGAGKSLIIAEFLLRLEKANMQALCLTLNSELIRQNSQAYKKQGGNCSIYCAALDQKDFSASVVFASPHSIFQSVKLLRGLKNKEFNAIVIDEAHNVNLNDEDSMYMTIINHYGRLAQLEGHSFRVVGLTGTPFRGKGAALVGPQLFFKHMVCDIGTEFLINNGFLVNPRWGKHEERAIDFSGLDAKNTGFFNGRELQEAVDKDIRLTGKIMEEVSSISKDRKGVFIFASTIEHCLECMKSLPENESAMIIGSTPSKERQDILDKARAGKIKYLVNVNVLTVGVDIPNFDTVVFVRPTESLVLYTQAIGRGLRLSPDKNDCLVLDYAGNLDRHGHINNPMINKAILQLAKDDPDYCIECYDCGQMNKVLARRCIGVRGKDRCDYYFEWKDCLRCETKNDRTARHCRFCRHELVDPNLKLTTNFSHLEKEVKAVYKSDYHVSIMPSGYHAFQATYTFDDSSKVSEHYYLSSTKSTMIFYHKFIKLHHPKPSKVYRKLSCEQSMRDMIEFDGLKNPSHIEVFKAINNYEISAKIFDNVIPQTKICHVVHCMLSDNNSQKKVLDYICLDNYGNYFIVTEQKKLPKISLYDANHGVGDFCYPHRLVVDQNNKLIDKDDSQTLKNDGYTTYVLKDDCWDDFIYLTFEILSKIAGVEFITSRLFGIKKTDRGHKIVTAFLRCKKKDFLLVTTNQVKGFSVSSYRAEKDVHELILEDGTRIKAFERWS